MRWKTVKREQGVSKM